MENKNTEFSEMFQEMFDDLWKECFEELEEEQWDPSTHIRKKQKD